MIRKSVVPTLVTLLVGTMLSGCSYLFMTEVKGSYEGDHGEIVGYMTMYFSDHSSGSVAIGRPKRQECQGEFSEIGSRTSVFERLDNVMRYYEGNLNCLEGRRGRFKLETQDGQSGRIVGQINGRKFELHIQPPSERWKYSYGDDWRGPSEKWREAMKKQRVGLN